MSAGALDPATITSIVIAKQPAPGLSKTRLAPAVGNEGAARLAEAALADTLETVAAVGGRRVLVLEGETGPWLPEGFEVIPQRGDGLDQRLASAFEDVGGPALLIGMDTPQVSAAHLTLGRRTLAAGGCKAVLGLATDGGWWAIGLRETGREIFEGVPMSAETTGARQIERLSSLGLEPELLPELTDVDLIEDALAVAAAAPDGRFAHVVRELVA